MVGSRAHLLLLTLGAVLLTGCVAPRATWAVVPVRGETAAPATEAPANITEPPVATEAGGGHAAAGRTHVVARGENLYRIALKYGLDPDELADANEISDPTKLAVGQELVIPGKGKPPASTGSAVAMGSRTPTRARVAPTVSSREPVREEGDGQVGKLSWPVQGVLFSRFGPRGATRHDGIDIAAPQGTPIHAAADGVVIYAGTQRGYGNIVIVRHEGDLLTLYAHNKKNMVKEGDTVRAGQPIGTVGRTGRATGPHCHFEVRRGTEPHDPLGWLPR